MSVADDKIRILDKLLDLNREHRHEALGDAGGCPECRQLTVDYEADAPHAFVLIFPDSNQVALVRSWAPTFSDAVDTAWATGCNTGGTVAGRPVDPDDAELAGLPWFTLLGSPWADRWMIEVPADAVCSHCGEPMHDGCGS